MFTRWMGTVTAACLCTFAPGAARQDAWKEYSWPEAQCSALFPATPQNTTLKQRGADGEWVEVQALAVPRKKGAYLLSAASVLPDTLETEANIQRFFAGCCKGWASNYKGKV